MKSPGHNILLSLLIVILLTAPTWSQPCDSLPDHYLFSDSTGASYAIQIDSLSAACLALECDEIGVFDGDLCVGATVIDSVWPLSVTAWQDDPVTPEVDGYVIENTISYRLYRTDAAVADSFYAIHTVVGDGTFGDPTGAQLWLECCESPDPMGEVDVGPNPICSGGLFCLTWPALPDIDYYEVREGDGDWVNVGNATQRCPMAGAAGEYNYEVRGCNDCGCGEAAAAPTLTVADLPGMVARPESDLNPVCLGEELCISWTAIPNVTHYDILADSGMWSDVGTDTNICFTGVPLGQHTYEVRAVNDCGDGLPSPVCVITVQLPPVAPDPPVTTTDPICIDLPYCISWGAVGTATYYEISEDDGDWVDLGDTTEYCLTKTEPGGHNYRIRACNRCGCSGPSTALNLEVGRTPQIPSTPSVSLNPACLNQEFCLTWPAVEWADYYELRENGGDWVDVGDVPSACITPTVAGNFSYTVRAVSDCGTSLASPARVVTVQQALAIPSAPTPDDDSVCVLVTYCITWSSVQGASSYHIRQNGGQWFNVTGFFQKCYVQNDPGQFTYEVRACDECGCTEASEIATVTVSGPPAAPTQLVADLDEVCPDQEYCLSWDAVGGAEWYEMRGEIGDWYPVGDTTLVCTTSAFPGGYTYRVRACSECGCGDESPGASVLVLPPPSPPATLTATPNPVCSDQELCLSWSTVVGAVGYEMRVDSGEWLAMGNVTEWCTTELSEGEFVYEVRACRDCGCGEAGPAVVVSVGASVGTAPQPVVDEDTLCVGSEYCLTWPSVPAADSYQIRVNGGEWSAAMTDTQVCYTADGGGNFVYEIRTCGACGCSDPSAGVTVWVLADAPTPESFAVDKDSVCSSESFCFSWAASPGAQYYEIGEQGGDWVNVGDTTGTCLQRAEMGDYIFELRACDSCGCSDPTDAITVRVATNLDPPAAPQASSNPACRGTEFTVSWDAVDGADYYEFRTNGSHWVGAGDSLAIQSIQHIVGSYAYEVRACNYCGCTAPSPELVVVVTAGPEPPANVAVSNDQVCALQEFCITWDTVAAATSYQISDGDGTWTSTGLDTEYCLTLPDTGEYSYEVRACSECGCGSNSEPLILSVTETAEAPSFVNCGVEDDQPRLEWTACGWADFYRVYRDNLPLKSTGQTYYTDTTAYPGQTYLYHIVAVGVCGEIPSTDSCLISFPSDVFMADDGDLPEKFALAQNYPNPFNPETRIEFELARAAHVRLDVINLLGRTVRTLADETLSPGRWIVLWDSRDDRGVAVSSGVYFYRLRTDDHTLTRKMLLLR